MRDVVIGRERRIKRDRQKEGRERDRQIETDRIGNVISYEC